MMTPFGATGRANAWAGFTDYFRNKGHELGSELFKARYQAVADKGISVDDIGKLERSL